MHRYNDAQLYRARVLAFDDKMVICRLIDFGLCDTVHFEDLFCLPENLEEDYPQIAAFPPFVSRVNLPCLSLKLYLKIDLAHFS